MSKIRVGKLLQELFVTDFKCTVNHYFDNGRKSRIVVRLNDIKFPIKFHAIINNLGFKVEHDYKGRAGLRWFSFVIIYDKATKTSQVTHIESIVSIEDITVTRPSSVVNLVRNRWIRRISDDLSEAMDKPLSNYYDGVLAKESKQWEADIVRLMTEPTFENDVTSVEDNYHELVSEWD